jgi:pSer/pThr/pTyr-binding forkhead associated (FHA) protein
MKHLPCACGASLQVSELYAGGQVLCQACGAMVLVPADLTAEDKFRFHCPHCETRVVGRKSSAGKKSQCPVCEKVYIVPEPPPEFDSPLQKDSRRIEIGTDELALKIGLPFPVGKLEPVTSRPPQARYMHDAEVDSEAARHAADLPAHVLPGSPDSDRPPFEPQIGELSDRQFFLPGPDHHEAAPTAEWPRTAEPVASRGPSSTAQTAAAIPHMTVTTTPASVGELQIVTGSCSGQRILLDFHHFVVGAERDCNLRPQSPLLSRHHCVFKKDEYSLRVRDLGSVDGTFVNGRRIFSEAILKPGDQVRIADVTIHVFLPRAPEIVQSKPDSMPSISDFVIL